jgi:Fe/S biogenesis protein NfuA
MTSEVSILTLTDSAVRMIRHHREQREPPNDALRLTVREDGPAAFDYKLQLVPEETATPEDTHLEIEGIVVIVDEDSIPNIRGTTLDYVDSLEGRSGFAFDNPNVPPLLRDPVASRVSQLLQERINPGLAAHGGRARLLDVRDGRVYLEFGGGCQGCGMVDVTLKRGVEACLKAEIPEIREVLDTTDHAAGTNPYYRAEAG